MEVEKRRGELGKRDLHTVLGIAYPSERIKAITLIRVA